MPKPLLLVVDDHTEARWVVALLLARKGFLVAEASGGREGIELARRLRPDVVLLDMAMPDVDGIAVATELRRDPELARTRIIAMTAHGDVERKMLAVTAGIMLYLVKPVAPAALLENVNLCLAARRMPTVETRFLVLDDHQGVATVAGGAQSEAEARRELDAMREAGRTVRLVRSDASGEHELGA